MRLPELWTYLLNTVASRYRYALQKLKDWVPEELDNSTPNISAT